MNSEIWRDIPGFEGLYQVSNRGRVRSMDMMTAHPGGGLMRRKSRILSPNTMRDGYRQVSLCREGVVKCLRVHRLVLMAFVGLPKDGMVACHCDNNPANNNLSNLRWDTLSGNFSDKIENGTSNRGERNNTSKLTESQAVEIKLLALAGESHASLSRRFGISKTSIYDIKNGRSWAHLFSGDAT